VSDFTRIMQNDPFVATQHGSAQLSGAVSSFFSGLLWSLRFAQLNQAEQNTLGVVDADALKRIAREVDSLH
jgi:hypothetical protein